jgi:hypothetical protein
MPDAQGREKSSGIEKDPAYGKKRGRKVAMNFRFFTISSFPLEAKHQPRLALMERVLVESGIWKDDFIQNTKPG